MRRFFSIAILCILAIGTYAQVQDTTQESTLQIEPGTRTVVNYETLKFGFVDYDHILKNVPEYAMAQQTIMELRQAYEEELSRSEEVFSKQFAEYVEGMKNFPDNIRLKRQKELQQTMEESMAFKQEAKELLQSKEDKVVDAIRAKIDAAIRDIAIERGYAFVINNDKGTYSFINDAIGEDITAEVARRLQEGNAEE